MKKMQPKVFQRFFIGGTFWAFAMNSFGAETSKTLDRQLLIQLKPGSSLKSFRAKMPKYLKIMADQDSSFGNFLIVQSNSAISNSLIARIKSDSQVKLIQRDSISSFHEGTLANDNLPCTPAQNSIAQLPDVSLITKNLTFPASCIAADHCSNNSMSSDWGFKEIDADLAANALKQVPQARPVKIADIDTGFGLHDPNVQTKQGWSGAGDPKTDENGHGSATMASVFGVMGAEGAKRAQFTSYRLTQAGNNGSADSSWITLAVTRACEDGNQIINLSWEFTPPTGFTDDLMSKGCLLVQAAGNSSDFQTVDATKKTGRITVEAAASSGDSALFGSSGQLFAPGVRVPLPMPPSSSLALELKAQNLSCGDKGLFFLSGSSFSSPITAGVFGMVREALNASPAYNKMSPSDQISTMLNVLQASDERITRETVYNSRMGEVNALRAVKLAQAWVSESSSKVPNSSDLNVALKINNASFCGGSQEKCNDSEKSNCQSFMSCLDTLREKWDICEPPSSKIGNALLSMLVQSGQTETGLGMLNQLQTDFPQSRSQQISENAHLLWRQEITALRSFPDPGHPDENFGKNLQAELMSPDADIMDRLLATWLTDPKDKTQDLGEISQAFVELFSDHPDISTQDGATGNESAAATDFKEAAHVLSPQKYASALEMIIDKNLALDLATYSKGPFGLPINSMDAQANASTAAINKAIILMNLLVYVEPSLSHDSKLEAAKAVQHLLKKYQSLVGTSPPQFFGDNPVDDIKKAYNLK